MKELTSPTYREVPPEGSFLVIDNLHSSVECLEQVSRHDQATLMRVSEV